MTEELPAYLEYLQSLPTEWKLAAGGVLLLFCCAFWFQIQSKDKAPISAKKLETPPDSPPKPVHEAQEPDSPTIPVPPPREARDFIRQGLEKTRLLLQQNLGRLFNGSKPLNHELLEELHESLFRTDMGTHTVDRLVSAIETFAKKEGSPDTLTWEDVRPILAKEALEILKPVQSGEISFASDKPHVILVVGVNGVGKTTTIGKLASKWKAEGKEVMLCAADTYRAAAIDQLKAWGERAGVKVVAGQPGSDPAAVAHDGVKAAYARGANVLMIDTAGRLQNKVDLMAELAKIKRVISKDDPTAPHEVLLVLDSTTGQNAFSQVEAFTEIVKLTGLIVTKLDGTAKGGVVLGVCDKFRIPLRFVGVGEKAEDLRPFDANTFVESLF